MSYQPKPATYSEWLLERAPLEEGLEIGAGRPDKPATGEWTEQQVMSLIDMGSGLSTVTRLTKAINAAFSELEAKLAVLTRENDGRDQSEAEYAAKMMAEIQARDKQLAAEREKVQTLVDALTEHGEFCWVHDALAKVK